MEPFKNHIHRGVVEDLARRIPGDWDRAAFVTRATDGLEALELKARVGQVTEALRASLPGDFPTAVALVEQAVGPPPDHTDDLTSDWGCWVLCTFVEHYGLGHPERALDAMQVLTPHFSCEFAVRPYFQADPDAVTARALRWAIDPDLHLRRLASEGTRPRLPWGRRLDARIHDPEQLLPVLELLRDDPQEYVRRSVANHLNDIGRDHPDLLLQIAARWLEGDVGRDRVRLVKHALRSLIKASDPRAFVLVGLLPFSGTARLAADPPCLALGEPIELTLHLNLPVARRLRLDLGFHHLRADGSHGLKVFHWTERDFGPGEHVLVKRHTIKRVTTRSFYAGEHGFDLRINGSETAPIRVDVEER